MQHIYNFIFVLAISGLYGQEINCKIIEAESISGVPFANVGLLKKNLGTVSDESGRFTLNIAGTNEEDSVRISCIGYVARTVTIGSLKQLSQTENIMLQPISYDLEEVVVVPKDYELRRVGNFMDTKNIVAGFMNNNLGHEIGTKIKMRRKPAYIQKVHINIARCDFDSIFYRLNIYAMKDKEPGENLLKEPVYIALSKEEAESGVIVDVSDQYILVDDDFLVSVELVKDLGPKDLFFSAGFFASRAFYRPTSQSSWEKIPAWIGIAIGVTILQES